MATSNVPFSIQKYDGFGGNFVDSQYLGASYDSEKPHVFEDMLIKLYSAQTRFTGKVLLGMIGGKKDGTIMIPTEVFRWRAQGAEEKSARVVENLEAGNATPGINGTTFRVKLDLDYFANPDVLFGEDNDYPLAIVSGPVQEGTGYIYTLKLQGDDPAIYFPPQYLEPNSEFTKVWTSTSSEANERFGTQQTPSNFMLESQISTFAQKLTITDRAMRQEGRLGFKFYYEDQNGKQKFVEKFLSAYEARMKDELFQSIEAQLTYGKKMTDVSHKGYMLKTGPGLREQLKDSWLEYYNGALTTTRVRDYLMSIYFSRTDTNDRSTTGSTGTLGGLMVHDMLASEASSFLTLDTHFTKQIPSQFGGKSANHLAFGAQYTRYVGPEGIDLTVVRNPMNDSRKYQKRTHPQYPDMPIDSARITFLGFGANSTERGIKMLKLKDYFRFGYTQNTIGRNGGIQGGIAGGLIAQMDMFIEGSAGIWLQDPSGHGELVFDHEI